MLANLLDIAVDLIRNLHEPDRYQRLLGSVRSVVPCDASALLKFEKGLLVPVAINGLDAKTLGRRFDPTQHPRFQQIMTSKNPVHFPADSPLADPYDGLVLNLEGALSVHSCMGCSLFVDNKLLGILTIDGLKAGMFENIKNKTLVAFSALASAAMQTALLLEDLEKQALQQNLLTQELIDEALKKDGGELIGQSQAMMDLNNEIKVVANSDLSVLIMGESGVGKELVARTIHIQSTRANQPLVYINCAALPESIGESELFGHVKGAFTGANNNRNGKFEIANGGTLFLDEIGELPLNIQAKLLRVLQNGEIQRVGSDKMHSVDVRILAATNRILKDEVVAGNFRQDLYHRLSVFPIYVPPLRERKGDVIILAGYFEEKVRNQIGLRNLRLSSDAAALLQQYEWPGNVRELEHVISRSALRAKSQQKSDMITIEAYHCDISQDIEIQQLNNMVKTTLDQSQLSNTNHQPEESLQPTENHQLSENYQPIESHQATENHQIIEAPQQIIAANNQELHAHKNDNPDIPDDLTLAEQVAQFQRSKINQALQHNDSNWSQAAKQLGMDRGNLHRLAKRLGLK